MTAYFTDYDKVFEKRKSLTFMENQLLNQLLSKTAVNKKSLGLCGTLLNGIF